MSSYFPIFVDVNSVPPLVIGDSDVLASKIRLLSKMAPIIDVVSPTTSSVSVGTSVDHINILAGVTPHDDAVLSMLAGRPLVIIETGDAARNKVLAQHARSLGVPVNVPDTISLCSFFWVQSSIVRRSLWRFQRRVWHRFWHSISGHGSKICWHQRQVRWRIICSGFVTG